MVQPQGRQLHDQENLLPRNRLLLVVGCLCLVLIFSFVDQNGISVTLPTIARDLSAASTISWAGTSSLIANTMFTALYGRLSDIFGRKVIFLASCALLAMADLLCGLSQNAAMLYVFRGVAGMGGGGISNLAMVIVSDIVTLENRGRYQGIIGACVGVGNIVGPFLAAGFTNAFSWRVFFWFLAPALTACTLVAMALLPANKPTDNFSANIRKVDWIGCGLVSLAVVLTLIPVSGGGLYFEWHSAMVISMLVLGGILFVAFIGYEWKVANLPMMPMSIFKSRSVSALLVQNFLFGWSYQSLLYYLPQYYQNVRGFDAMASAALSVPVVVLQAVSSVLSGLYISKYGRYGEVLWFGFGAWTAGSIIMSTVFSASTHPAVCVVSLSIIGAGVGNIFQPVLVALQAHSPKDDRAVIISARNFFRCCGGACGLAASAAVLQASLRDNLDPEYRHVVEQVYALPELSAQENRVVINAYMAAIRNVFIMDTVVIGACLLACILVKDAGLKRKETNSDTTPPSSEETVSTVDTKERQ